MREFTCIVCGVKGIDKSPEQNKLCCSQACNNRRRIQKSIKWPCVHNVGVQCSRKDCDRCGWNPKVAKARREAFI